MAKKRARNVQTKKETWSIERIIIASTVALTVLAVGIVGLNAWNSRQVNINEVERIFGLSRGHQELVTYDTEDGLPPAGGVHHPAWQNCGVYDIEIRADHAVHSLEHGAVWITYDPEIVTGEDLERLQDLTRGGTHRLLSPFPGQPSPVVATAWGYQLQLDDAGDGRLKDFIRNYEQGPQTPEPGARCGGAIGNPL